MAKSAGYFLTLTKSVSGARGRSAGRELTLIDVDLAS
jgi:hypothetical protein